MSLDDRTLVRVILVLVAIWLAVNVLGDVLNLLANSVVAAAVALVLILWYLNYI